MAKFNYGQKFQRRVISDSPLERFRWDLFAFDTQYNEPFGHVSLGQTSSQGFVPDQAVRPIRIFNLDFSGMKIYEENPGMYPLSTNFNLLYAFYLRHGTHKRFIFEHPVYGDLIVRFGKPLSVPKKTPNGLGSLQTFQILLIESITTHYMFMESESFEGDLPFHASFFDVEIDTEEDTLVAPLGNNYEMVFKRAKKPLRTIKLTVQGLKYFLKPDGSLDISTNPSQNMMLLELFYLKHRLRDRFVFNYMGEDIPVRFKEPLKIPKVEGNTGVLGSVELMLIETPNKPIYEMSDLNVSKVE